MSVLVWVHGHVWWLIGGLVAFEVAVFEVLHARRYRPAHAGPPSSGERWVPWKDDPDVGSMDLDADRALGHWRGHWVSAPPLDWREVAHEEDWRDQTAAALAPAVLDSGPGGLAWPGPDQFRNEAPGSSGSSWGAPGLATQGGERAVSGLGDEWPSVPQPAPPPEPVWTVAGRLVETSGEWLRRLERDAGPGWTYAGTVAA